MFLRDPPGIISERETSKLDESNHSNLLKAWYIVSRTISHNLGGLKQARLSFSKCAPVSFQGLMQPLGITKFINQRKEKLWLGRGEGCRCRRVLMINCSVLFSVNLIIWMISPHSALPLLLLSSLILKIMFLCFPFQQHTTCYFPPYQIINLFKKCFFS